MTLREPWASMVRAALRVHVAIAVILLVFNYTRFALVGEPPSLAACAERQFGPGDLRQPALIAYLAHRSMLWPVSLAWTTAGTKWTMADWFLVRYDPFEWC